MYRPIMIVVGVLIASMSCTARAEPLKVSISQRGSGTALSSLCAERCREPATHPLGTHHRALDDNRTQQSFEG
jgi:hypothetical protein